MSCGRISQTYCSRLHRVGICNRLEDENTPTKTFARVAVAEDICQQCSKLVDNLALRRRLFTGLQKKKTYLNLELLLRLQIICRNCSDRNETFAKKVFKVKENFSKQKKSLVLCVFSLRIP